ncbi:MAG: mandelate racemase [Acidimicrobiia bacterium]|nr:MAG: mandelate racemase [Acidimicrobiia bacterium]
MKIERLEVIPIKVPLGTTFQGSKYAMSSRATLITRIYTDSGVVGESYNGDEDHTQLQIARIILDELGPLIKGLDPLLVERCWETMLPPTFDILRDRRLVMMGIAAIDSALWDLCGKVAGLPLYRLWGGFRDELPVIAIGGYYGRSDAELAKEAEDYRRLGIGGCKFKVGGATPEEDARRFAVMRKAAGDDFVMMADANQGYTVEEAIEFVRRVEGLGLRWFEEPVRWYNDGRGMRDVRLKSGIPVAAGQSEMSRKGIAELILNGSIDICNFDASWGGGPTEWRRVAGLAATMGVQMAHHEEAQIAAHLLASVSHGTYVEVFHPERDPVFWNLIANRPTIANGIYEVPQGPGFGLELDPSYIERYRVDS